ncbi:MobA/MobL family protein [Luteimonas sp. Y-2-2-4F]|nr:MobA/MobL family protein [Luteimonas sp. Y-2-2-4F]MCD9030854.1 MobA/MobL family protein [Luteimonas sp. Y-2-2-4F]
MAIYHTRVKTISRAKGNASTAAAAYRAGLLIEEANGKKHDYRRRSGVVETRVVVPHDAPDWASDPHLLWPHAEVVERRRDATVAREFEIALPHELNDDQRSELTSSISHALVERYGFAVQASIHEPPTRGGLNYHAHLLATTRRLTSEGLADKTRELDGGPSGRSEVEWIRATVARIINAKLEAAGVLARVDHRSLKAQSDAALEEGDLASALALSREPTQHMGKDATALHRKGVETERMRVNQEIRDTNEASFQAAMAALGDTARLMPTPVGHSHARARQEREAEGGFRLPAALSGSPDDQIRFDPAQAASTPKTERQADADQAKATQAALAQATVLWGEGFFTTISLAFKATTKLLRHQVDRLATYVHSALFRADVRQLLEQIKQVKRDAQRFQRRLKAEERAQHALAQAEFLLERFDSEHPRPDTLSRQEWMRRRARRLRAVQVRQEAYKRAHEATDPEAQTAYNTRALASGEQLEQWSERMLKRYPVEADREAVPDSTMGPGAGEGRTSSRPTPKPS